LEIEKMITAEIKRLHSPDILDLATYEPEVADTFGFLLQIMAGPSGGDGEESFDVTVCAPQWLAERIGPSVLIGRHHLIVSRYDFRRLKQFLENYCSKCTGNTWQEVAQQLGRIGKWEFEDYRP
jgi:hypothetical protein